MWSGPYFLMIVVVVRTVPSCYMEMIEMTSEEMLVVLEAGLVDIDAMLAHAEAYHMLAAHEDEQLPRDQCEELVEPLTMLGVCDRADVSDVWC